MCVWIPNRSHSILNLHSKRKVPCQQMRGKRSMVQEVRRGIASAVYCCGTNHSQNSMTENNNHFICLQYYRRANMDWVQLSGSSVDLSRGYLHGCSHLVAYLGLNGPRWPQWHVGQLVLPDGTISSYGHPSWSLLFIWSFTLLEAFWHGSIAFQDEETRGCKMSWSWDSEVTQGHFYTFCWSKKLQGQPRFKEKANRHLDGSRVGIL